MKTTVTDATGAVQSVQVSEGEQPHSIEVNRNAKQEYSYSVKVYYADDCASGAVDRIKKIYAELDAHFGTKGG